MKKAKELLQDEIEDLKDNEFTEKLLDKFDNLFEELDFEKIGIDYSNDNKKIFGFFYIMGVLNTLEKVGNLK